MLKGEAAGGFGILDTAERQKKLLAMLENEQIAEQLLDAFEKRPAMSGAERWKRIKSECKTPKLAAVLTEVVFTYTYPRLDVNVSKGMNHLLKSPWCVHPKTGRVCVPVNVSECEEFDPSSVPTLKTIADDLDAGGASLKDGRDISRTRLAPFEAAFDAFLAKCENAIRGERAREKAAAPLASSGAELF
mmetsp:Transcript_15837/g.49441  ORF Transcript_15837/g.49441 Transcript_15837/m.49441 type:complete len:189 (+) Transcript_15837:46-612(+)